MYCPVYRNLNYLSDESLSYLIWICISITAIANGNGLPGTTDCTAKYVLQVRKQPHEIQITDAIGGIQYLLALMHIFETFYLRSDRHSIDDILLQLKQMKIIENPSVHICNVKNWFSQALTVPKFWETSQEQPRPLTPEPIPSVSAQNVLDCSSVV